MNDEELLTVAEAAERAGVAQSTIRSAVKRGRGLEWVLWRGRKLLKVADVDAWRNATKIGRPSKQDVNATLTTGVSGR